MKQTHRGIVMIVIFSLLMLVVIGMFSGMLYRIHTASVYTTEVNTKIISAQKKEGEFSSLQKTIIATDASKNMLASHFVTSEHIVTFLEALEQYGKNANVAFSLVSVDEEKDGKSLRVSFQADGTFVAVHRFLLLLENAPYEINIDQVTLSSAIDVTKSTIWNMSGSIHLISFTH